LAITWSKERAGYAGRGSRGKLEIAEYLWNFVLVYIDDIIIFSRTKEQHLSHLDQLLALLAGSGITLAAQNATLRTHRSSSSDIMLAGLGSVQQRTRLPQYGPWCSLLTCVNPYHVIKRRLSQQQQPYFKQFLLFGRFTAGHISIEENIEM
jgi:hypothetical protein